MQGQRRSGGTAAPAGVVRCAAAVDMGATKTAAGLVAYREGEAPEVVWKDQAPTGCEAGGEHVMGVILEQARRALDQARARGLEPAGVGVCAATSINAFEGSVAASNGVIDGWAGMPVRARLEQALDVPADVLGDVQAHALGEARWGAGRGYRVVLCIAPGTGVGGGIVVEGRLFKGAHGIAGHVGHTMSLAGRGVECACGSEGHVEPVASGPAIAAAYQGLPLGSAGLDPAVDGAEVSRRAAAGDRLASSVLEEAGFALGQAAGSCANVVDPDVVVLSGSVSHAGGPWRSSFARGYASQALAPVRSVPVVGAALADSALVGAAEDLFDSVAAGGQEARAARTWEEEGQGL